MLICCFFIIAIISIELRNQQRDSLVQLRMHVQVELNWTIKHAHTLALKAPHTAHHKWTRERECDCSSLIQNSLDLAHSFSEWIEKTPHQNYSLHSWLLTWQPLFWHSFGSFTLKDIKAVIVYIAQTNLYAFYRAIERKGRMNKRLKPKKSTTNWVDLLPLKN